jgi:hypothetical protein
MFFIFLYWLSFSSFAAALAALSDIDLPQGVGKFRAK